MSPERRLYDHRIRELKRTLSVKQMGTRSGKPIDTGQRLMTLAFAVQFSIRLIIV